MTPEFLRLSLEEREQYLPKWTKLASEYGIKVLFWGLPMGVTEHVVIVFEDSASSSNYFIFWRKWLGLGTQEAGKIIKNTRTIIVS
jgi:hypothetical protein